MVLNEWKSLKWPLKNQIIIDPNNINAVIFVDGENVVYCSLRQRYCW